MGEKRVATHKKKKSSVVKEQEIKELSMFVRAAVRLGCRYLSVGGPTSRLEDQLTKAGESKGYRTEVFTTPTGVFVSAVLPGRQKVVTFVGRVKEISFNLSELEVMERTLQKISSGELTAKQALYYVSRAYSKETAWDVGLKTLGSFLIGTMSALLNYGSMTVAACAGVLTLFVHYLSGPMSDRLKFNPIFSNFFAATVGFGVSAALSVWLSIPMEAVALGSLIILAPGLMITTAISEIAEQNYVSGIAKLMKSGINLCGMLVSYLLVSDALNYLDLKAVPMSAISYNIQDFGVLVSYSIYTLIVLGMCLALQVPKKAIPGASIAAFISWTVFNLFDDPSYYVSATFVATLSVGFVSLLFGALYKLPSQIFSVPGVLALVPGVLAMTSFSSLAGLDSFSIEVGIKVLLIASAIVFGLFTARMPFMIVTKDEYGLDPHQPDFSKFKYTHANEVVETDKDMTLSPNSDSTIAMF